jgi:hypothetical protein
MFHSLSNIENYPKVVKVYMSIRTVALVCVLHLLCVWNFAYSDGMFSLVDSPHLNTQDKYQGLALASSGTGALLYLSKQNGPGQLFDIAKSEWRSVLNEVSYRPSGSESGVAWGDYDGDGEAELFIARYEQKKALLRYEKESLRLASNSNIADRVGLGDEGPAQGATWVDYDGDGDLDLYVAQLGAPNQLYRNEDGETFVLVDEGIADPSRSISAAWGDYNADGFMDLYVANYNQPNRLYVNRGAGGGFEDMGKKLRVADGGPSLSAVWVDYNNDGQWELSVAQNGSPNRLFEYDAQKKRFDDMARKVGLADGGQTQMMSWGDYDCDGDLDVLVVNGGEQTPDLNRLYRNDGKRFASVSMQLGLEKGAASGAKLHKGSLWWDAEGDGDLDLFVITYGQGNFLFRNDGLADKAHSLSVLLINDTDANLKGHGSLVRLWTKQGVQSRYVGLGGSYLSQESLSAHFAVGHSPIDSLTILWPDGNRQIGPSINSGGKIVVRKGRPELVIKEKEIDFGHVPADVDERRFFFIENVGESRLRVDSLIVKSGQRGRSIIDARVIGTSVPFFVIPGGQVKVDVGFAPNGIKSEHKAEVRVVTNAGAKRVAVKGVGAEPGAIIVESDPSQSTKEQGTITIENKKRDAVVIEEVSIKSNPDLVVDTPDLPRSLKRGDKLTINVKLKKNGRLLPEQEGTVIVRTKSGDVAYGTIRLNRRGNYTSSQDNSYSAWKKLNRSYLYVGLGGLACLGGVALVSGADVEKYENEYAKAIFSSDARTYKDKAKSEMLKRNIGFSLTGLGMAGLYFVLNQIEENKNSNALFRGIAIDMSHYRTDGFFVRLKRQW